MAVEAHEILNLIEKAFPDAQTKLVDLVGDKDHYELTVESASFSGKSKVQQHKMVMDALNGMLGGALHALSIKTIVKE